ncbi:hypothetical protein PoB_006716100 [Plakobranchus ocellatus]|uniref:Uncharacterized protein n=1 Tax=Plakobranchus ocellatus TaxID=259542 RepID=A0AAV4D9C8_9GAST|nr:hypothetical protein PoB_006716100 [Plakobranchus ocellatus]
MAARRSEAIAQKEKTLDMLEKDFLANVENYVSAVKAAIRDEPPTKAEEIYHSAVAFFTNEPPDPTCQAITLLQSKPTNSTVTPEQETIEDPWGVTTTSEGLILVTDTDNTILHLVSSEGTLTKQLWSVPSDRDQDDQLYAVSIDWTVCVCVTKRGSVYILDCEH